MAPASLIRKVMGYELSESKKRKKMTNNKKAPAKKKKKVKAAPKKLDSNGKSTTLLNQIHRKQAKSKKAAKTLPQGKKASKPASTEPVLEYSPNRRAKCRSCDTTIGNNKLRVGIPISTSTSSGYRYYHAKCLPENLRQTLSPKDRKQVLYELNQKILSQRSQLVKKLKLKYNCYFEMEVIYNMAIALPRNEVELLKFTEDNPLCFAMDTNLSGDILQDIRNFAEQTRTPSEATEIPRIRQQANISTQQANGSPEIIVIDDSDDENDIAHEIAVAVEASMHDHGVKHGANNSEIDGGDDDEIAIEETLTSAQVVQQKFDRAAANGEILAID